MSDRLLLSLCLSAAGAIVGLLVGRCFKLRKEYFDEFDGLLRRYVSTLSFSLDTVPALLSEYAAKSKLLARHLAQVVAEMKGASIAPLSVGFLKKSELEFASATLRGLGTRNVIGEKNAAEGSRLRLEELRSAADDQYSKLGKSSIKLGFLFGLLLSVLCW